MKSNVNELNVEEINKTDNATLKMTKLKRIRISYPADNLI